MSEKTAFRQRALYPVTRFIDRMTARREKQRLCQMLVDGAADYAIFMLSPRGMITSWSAAAEKIFGYAAGDVIGEHYKLLYPSSRQTAQNIERQLIIAIAHGRFEEVGLRRRKNGTQFWANSVVAPLHDARGKLQGYSNITRDITERKQSEAALEAKEKELQEARKVGAIGRLANGVAHDLTNLLTGISGMAQDLYEETPVDDSKRDDLMQIVKAARRGSNLTKQLLAVGRGSGSPPKVININHVIVDLSPILRRMVGHDIELKLALSPSGGNIKIDPTQLEQILINLVLNARDAMPHGGQIRIETYRILPGGAQSDPSRAWGPNPTMALVVSDNGIGMNDEICSHIFEPFYTTKSQDKGSGLGLTTVLGIVRQNNGDISVESKPGQGSSFKVVFPEIDQRTPVHAS
jgi:PAS domain S-box-containing protein